mmetsp:Transcript_15670/g.2211  ORF Transcript_15670/g.2211 Transcript_15670/m.2211 type:complete len:110 (+) Transcript_15670:52-381(+)
MIGSIISAILSFIGISVMIILVMNTENGLNHRSNIEGDIPATMKEYEGQNTISIIVRYLDYFPRTHFHIGVLSHSAILARIDGTYHLIEYMDSEEVFNRVIGTELELYY